MERRVSDAIRPQDWASAVSLTAAGAGVWSLLRRRWRAARRFTAAAVVADLVGRQLSHRHPAPFGAPFRFLLVHPAGDRRRLLESLEPKPGERVLEIGPGAGHHAVEVAQAVAPDGQVDVLDIQPEMLDAVMDRARRHGVQNVIPSVSDACEQLPYDDATFDAAYMASVLGELPNPEAALRELRRVVKNGGRLVIGEVVLDPDFVTVGRLRRLAEPAGFDFEYRFGSPAMYHARFRAHQA